MKKQLFLIAVIVCSFISCGGEDVDCTDESIQTVLITAGNTLYATIGHKNSSGICCLILDPSERLPETEEECWAFDKAYEEYINTLKDFRDCDINLLRTIEEAKSKRAALNCN